MQQLLDLPLPLPLPLPFPSPGLMSKCYEVGNAKKIMKACKEHAFEVAAREQTTVWLVFLKIGIFKVSLYNRN